MYVCLCFGITEQQVHAQIEAGACSPRQIASACKAGTDCGGCVKRIQAMLGRPAVCSRRGAAAAAGTVAVEAAAERAAAVEALVAQGAAVQGGAAAGEAGAVPAVPVKAPAPVAAPVPVGSAA